MTDPTFLNGPLPIVGDQYGIPPAGYWAAPVSPLDPDDVRALTAQGLRADEIAELRGCRVVHVAETAFVHDIRLNPARSYRRAR